MYLFGLLISRALYSRSSSDEKEILQGKTIRAHIFFKFCANFYLFDCLSAVWCFCTTRMTNYMGTIAIARCDGKKVKRARLALFTMSLLLYLSDVFVK